MSVKKLISKKKTKKPTAGKKAVLKKKTAKTGAPSKSMLKKLVASVVKKKPTVKPVKFGKVVHYYNHIKVGIVKLSAPILTGQKVHFKGATTDFSQSVSSMQINHEAVKKARKGQVIGLKVSKRVRHGDLMYKA